MEYSKLVKVYNKLENTSKRLEKTAIVAALLHETHASDLSSIINLLQGKVFPVWDERKIGFSIKLAIKSISLATGISPERAEKEFTKKGDLGLVSEYLIEGKKQTTLLSKKLTVEHVFENIRKLSTLEGGGSVYKKIQLVTELLTSATPLEAKFITRTIIEQLRVGVSAGILRDSIAWAYLPRVKGINYFENKLTPVSHPRSLEEVKKIRINKYALIDSGDEKLNRAIYNYFIEAVQRIFDIKNDFALVVGALQEKGLEAVHEKIVVGNPINPMLAIKSENFQEAFEALGKPVFFDTKIDGFRLQIHHDKEKTVLFTRNLENVTKQFPEIVDFVKKNIKGNSFILDGEAVGYDPRTKKHLPFQTISQRIKRKHDIEEMAKQLPVDLHVFDLLYYQGKNLMHTPFHERRKMLEKITLQEKHKIILTEGIVTDSEKEAEIFYKKVLHEGYEGVMGKKLDAFYHPGRYVEGWVKLKPVLESLDLVIVSAEYGEGKRTGWLTSYTLACRKDGKFVEIGKASTGLKEKSEGLSFKEMTKLLKPLIIEQKGKEVKVKPVLVIEVGYEEIQKSPTYDSGWALRFPRLIRLRNEKGVKDCEDIQRIERIYNSQRGKK